MTLIPELRAELAATLERRARRRRRLLFGLTPVALVATGGLALAASGAFKTQPTAAIGKGRSDADSGVVAKGTDRLLPVSTEGWQLRLTRRGEAGCLTPERVGGPKAEPLPIRDCGPLDAGRRLFMSAVDGKRAYGTLGPNAQSLTYETPAGPKTVATTGPEGAYLIELSSTFMGAGRYPVHPDITSITFRDGRTCTRDQFDAKQCPLPGFRPPKLNLPDQDEVGGPIIATARQGRRFWNLRVKFRARVATDGIVTGYSVRMFPPGHTGRSAMAVVDQPVRAGQLVEKVFQHVNGGGEYRIVVTYNRVDEPGQQPAGNLNPVTVGRKRITFG
jgi:hypothetical protein